MLPQNIINQQQNAIRRYERALTKERELKTQLLKFLEQGQAHAAEAMLKKSLGG